MSDKSIVTNRPADMTSHMVIILRWKQWLNCVKRWLNTYYRMAGWYISTHWPSGKVTAPDKLPWSRPAEICGWPRSGVADLTSHMVIILRWKQGLNCVKRWLNTYYRMAGWHISTHWPSFMVTAPDKLPWSRPAEICGWPRSRPHMVIILRWKQGLNCVKRWLNTYYRMAGWYISWIVSKGD